MTTQEKLLFLLVECAGAGIGVDLIDALFTITLCDGDRFAGESWDAAVDAAFDHVLLTTTERK